MMNSLKSLKFNKDELALMLKSLKIIENGEALLGIDIDRKLVSSLAEKLSKQASSGELKKIDDFIRSLIKEAEEYRNTRESVDSDYSGDFDEMFGPSYPYSGTLKILEKAIDEGKCVEINYYSASQGKFTKRKVQPKSIERKSGKPYINAYCFLRNEDRVFKVGRIKEITMVD